MDFRPGKSEFEFGAPPMNESTSKLLNFPPLLICPNFLPLDGNGNMYLHIIRKMSTTGPTGSENSLNETYPSPPPPVTVT